MHAWEGLVSRSIQTPQAQQCLSLSRRPHACLTLLAGLLGNDPTAQRMDLRGNHTRAAGAVVFLHQSQQQRQKVGRRPRRTCNVLAGECTLSAFAGMQTMSLAGAQAHLEMQTLAGSAPGKESLTKALFLARVQQKREANCEPYILSDSLQSTSAPIIIKQYCELFVKALS
jgi:hypothetical protein